MILRLRMIIGVVVFARSPILAALLCITILRIMLRGSRLRSIGVLSMRRVINLMIIVVDLRIVHIINPFGFSRL